MLGVETRRVEVPTLPATSATFGLASTATNPDEDGVAMTVTFPARPKLPTLTVVVPLCPDRTVTLEGWADSVKLPETVKVTRADRTMVPLDAVITAL